MKTLKQENIQTYNKTINSENVIIVMYNLGMDKRTLQKVRELPLPVINDWGIPPLLIQLIQKEREEAIEKGDPSILEKATDTEVLAVLYQVSLTEPLNEQGVNLYLHLFREVMAKTGIEVPPDMREVELSEWELRQLEEFKRNLRKKMKRKRR